MTASLIRLAVGIGSSARWKNDSPVSRCLTATPTTPSWASISGLSRWSSVSALSGYLRAAKKRGVDVSSLALALQRKYVNPFSVVVMAFIGMPLALAFGRRGALVAMCMAVGVSIAYWGVGGGFQQLGDHGLLPPEVAAWSPPVLFAAVGTYFLSRVRT